MPPIFLRSMLIIPKDQLYHYKLHKIIIKEYNEYIEEMCTNVKDISNRLSRADKNYSYMKNTEKKSKNLYPSFKKKINEILLKHASAFGFKEYHQHQQEEKHPCHHQEEEHHHHQKKKHHYHQEEKHHYHQEKEHHCHQKKEHHHHQGEEYHHHQKKEHHHHQEEEHHHQKKEHYYQQKEEYYHQQKEEHHHYQKKKHHHHQKEEYHHYQEEKYHHQEEKHRHHLNLNKKLLKKINKKKIRYMHNILYKEFNEYKKNNSNNINLDLKEYPPVEVELGEKNKNLKSVDSISMHYNLSKFQTIEGKY